MKQKKNFLINTSQKNIDKESFFIDRRLQTTPSKFQSKQGVSSIQFFPKSRKRINTVQLTFTEPCENYYELTVNRSQFPHHQSLYPIEQTTSSQSKIQNLNKKQYFSRGFLFNESPKQADLKQKQVEQKIKALDPIDTNGLWMTNGFFYQNQFQPKFQPKRMERKFLMIKKQPKFIELNGCQIKLKDMRKEAPTPQFHPISPRQKTMKKQYAAVDNYKLTAWDTNTEDIQIYDDLLSDFFSRS